MPQQEHECKQAKRLLATALRWLAEYAEWALAQPGADYRAACLAAWPRQAATTPERAPQAWRELAQACEELLMK